MRDGEIRKNDNLAVKKQVTNYLDSNMNKYGQLCYSVD